MDRVGKYLHKQGVYAAQIFGVWYAEAEIEARRYFVVSPAGERDL